MTQKILILSASPQRDKVVDALIAEELKVRGHDVWVRPCLREGRDAVIELEPDIVVTPPIRNPYSRDFVEQLKYWGCGVVSRHTEPSCSWQDWKKMGERARAEMAGLFNYVVDAELVWGPDEADILGRMQRPFPIVPVGAFMCDAYFDNAVTREMRGLFNEKYHFDTKKKKNLLISSAWGFADTAPDLRIPDIKTAHSETESRDRQIAFIKAAHAALGDKWNILVTLHPGVQIEPYRAALDGIALDTDATAFELLTNSDALIHAGSTMAVEMHLLNRPAYQLGDVNVTGSDSWWGAPDSAISKVSPYFKDPNELIKALRRPRKTSNANLDAIKVLKDGRYGLMDGQATKRAADVICGIEGKFKHCWPKSHRDYDQLLLMKDENRLRHKSVCGICRHEFIGVNPVWINQFCMAAGVSDAKKASLIEGNSFCPHCSSKFYRD